MRLLNEIISDFDEVFALYSLHSSSLLSSAYSCCTVCFIFVSVMFPFLFVNSYILVYF